MIFKQVGLFVLSLIFLFYSITHFNSACEVRLIEIFGGTELCADPLDSLGIWLAPETGESKLITLKRVIRTAGKLGIKKKKRLQCCMVI